MNRQIRVLVVDDDQGNLDFLALAFKASNMADFECIGVRDPNMALAKAIEVKPDFIVLDVFMEDKSGLEVCQELNLNHLTSKIPIMFFSASSNQAHINQSFLFGSVAYLQKGTAIQDVIQTIIVHEAITPITRALDRLSLVCDVLGEKYTSTPPL